MKLNLTLKILIAVLSVVLAGMVGVAVFVSQEPPVAETVPTTETTDPTVPTTEETEPTETVPPTTEPDPKLVELMELNEQNPDIDGWLVIDDTVIDYPVAYTPDEPEKYDRLSVDGKYSYHGTLYIGKQCSMDPESDNLIIYGHNLENGKMFSDLLLYKDEEYWEEHPVIKLYTVDGVREYQVLSTFYDRVYYSYENVFKFYKFVDAIDEEDYNNAIATYLEKALYETGVEPEYGDRLLTLITCSYHHQHGRFVVVAVEILEDDPLATETTQPAA